MLKESPEINLREVQLCISSPMASETESEKASRTRLSFADVFIGESLFVPFEIIHEPGLRVKISRANTIPNGKRFRLIKHGPPLSGYEIACIDGPERPISENVGNADESEPESEAAQDEPQWKPPIIED